MRSLIAISGFLAAQPGVALAQQTTQPYYHGPHMWGGSYGWFMGPIMMILTIGAAIAVVVLLAKWFGNSPQSFERAHKTPMDILRERFAKGEIDKEEFEERRKVLG